MSDKTMKPCFPPRLAGWQYQYERAEVAEATADRFEKLAHAEAMELVRIAAENDDLREALEIKTEDAKFLFITEQKAIADKRKEWATVWKQRAHLDNMRAFQWRKIATKRLELLRQIEWIPDANGIKKYDWCPICNNLRGTGHADDCELEKELADE